MKFIIRDSDLFILVLREKKFAKLTKIEIDINIKKLFKYILDNEITQILKYNFSVSIFLNLETFKIRVVSNLEPFSYFTII